MQSSKSIVDRTFRLPVRLLVKFSGEEFKGNYFIENMSAGGLFIQTNRPIAINSKMSIEVILPHDQRKKIFSAEVRWIRATSDEEGQPAGMGIQFVDMSQEDQDYLRYAINQYNDILGEELA